ncbi:alpha/beta hydrolase [Chloroflexota bacterium]
MTQISGDLTWFHSHSQISIILLVIFIILFILAWLAFKPIKVSVEVTADPTRSYEEALARIEAIQADEDFRGDLNPVCHTTLMTHNNRTEDVIVFLHGFTSCTEQFVELGKQFYERGYNVYIPRMPHHGLTNLMTDDLLDLTAEESIVFANKSVDIAQGLGERVTVSGLSGGGTMTAWLAQQRDDVDVAMPMSPFLGIKFIPAPLTRTFTNAVLTLPNMWMWWDPIHKENNPRSAPYSYRRYPTHALAELMRLGFVTAGEARRKQPASSKIIVVTNANDDSISNKVVCQLVNSWHKHYNHLVDTYEFGTNLNLPHDFITPARPDAHIEISYPIILELLDLKE